jgi:hypothetical protein
MATRPNSRSKKVRAKRRVELPTTYVLRITGWDWSFSFGLNHAPRLSTDPYSDYRHLVVTGEFIAPTAMKGKVAAYSFLPSRELNIDFRQEAQPMAVGSLSAHTRPVQGLFSIPADALAPLLQMLIGDRFHWIVASGDALRFRKTSLNSFRFEMTLDPDDI